MASKKKGMPSTVRRRATFPGGALVGARRDSDSKGKPKNHGHMKPLGGALVGVKKSTRSKKKR